MSISPTEFKDYSQYILSLERPLYDLVKEETDLRLKYLIQVVNHPVECLRVISYPPFSSNGSFSAPSFDYRVNCITYQTFLNVTSETIRTKCEKGINFGRFKKPINEKNIWNTMKGYWFGVVPVLIGEYLWVPLLKDITQFFDSVADTWINHNSRFDKPTMLCFLHKKFLTCLLEVKCKLTSFSNPSGSLIQYACWKQKPFQQVITAHFDHHNSYKFSQWGATQKRKGPKSMSIRHIVSKCIKMHAQTEYKIYIRSIGIDEDYKEFEASAIDSTTLFYSTNHTNNNAWIAQTNPPLQNAPPVMILPQIPRSKSHYHDTYTANHVTTGHTTNTNNNNKAMHPIPVQPMHYEPYYNEYNNHNQPANHWYTSHDHNPNTYYNHSHNYNYTHAHSMPVAHNNMMNHYCNSNSCMDCCRNTSYNTQYPESQSANTQCCFSTNPNHNPTALNGNIQQNNPCASSSFSNINAKY
eukprot:8082_1